LLMLVYMIPFGLRGQENELNQLDESGKKQGKWVRYYPNGKIRYQGVFTNDKPIGEFRRYHSDGYLLSLQNFEEDSDTVATVLYFHDGSIAAEGIFVAKMKQGNWKYYSNYLENHLLMSLNYVDDKREGLSIKYHWNGEVSETLYYNNDLKHGEWKQYFNDGVLCISSKYDNGKLNGDFLTWHLDGKQEITGFYKNDVREGKWSFFNPDGSLKRDIIYYHGIAENQAELIKEETEYLDRLEKGGGKIPDPEKTGRIIR